MVQGHNKEMPRYIDITITNTNADAWKASSRM